MGVPVILYDLSKAVPGLNMAHDQWAVLIAMRKRKPTIPTVSSYCYTLEAPVFLLTRLTGSVSVI